MRIAIASWLMDFDGTTVKTHRQGAVSGEAYVIKQLHQELSAQGHEVLLLERNALVRSDLEHRGIDFLLGCTCWEPLPVSPRYVTGYYHLNYWYRYPRPDPLHERFARRWFGISRWARLLMETRADVYFTNSPPMRHALESSGQLAYLAPLFADVEYYRPGAPDPRYACDACYLGGNLPYKGAEQVRDYLVAASEVCDFRIYGLGWDRHPVLKKCWGGVLPSDDVPKLYSSAAIVINFNATLQGKTGMCNNRFFEALACGAYVVSDTVPWAEEIFAGLISFTPGGAPLRRLLPELLADRTALCEKALQAREIIRQRFTPRQIVDQFLEGYHEARQRQEGPRPPLLTR